MTSAPTRSGWPWSCSPASWSRPGPPQRWAGTGWTWTCRAAPATPAISGSRSSCSFLRSGDLFTRRLGTAGQIHLTDPYHPGPDDSFTLFEEGKEPRGYASIDEAPSFTAAIRHIQRVVQGQEAPRHLAVDNSLPTARALDALHEAVAQDQCADQDQPDGQ